MAAFALHLRLLRRAVHLVALGALVLLVLAAQRELRLLAVIELRLLEVGLERVALVALPRRGDDRLVRVLVARLALGRLLGAELLLHLEGLDVVLVALDALVPLMEPDQREGGLVVIPLRRAQVGDLHVVEAVAELAVGQLHVGELVRVVSADAVVLLRAVVAGGALLAKAEVGGKLRLRILLGVALLALLHAVLPVERPSGEPMVEVAFAAEGLPVDRGVAPLAGADRLLLVLGVALLTGLLLHVRCGVEAFARVDPIPQRLVSMAAEALLVRHTLAGVVALVADDRKRAEALVRQRARTRLTGG